MTSKELMNKLESKHAKVFKRITDRKEAYWELLQSEDLKAFSHKLRFFSYTTALVDAGLITKSEGVTLRMWFETKMI